MSLRSSIAARLRRLAHRIDRASNAQITARGPIGLDVTMARDIGWTDQQIEDFWFEIEVLMRRHGHPVDEITPAGWLKARAWARAGVLLLCLLSGTGCNDCAPRRTCADCAELCKPFLVDACRPATPSAMARSRAPATSETPCPV